MAHLVPSDINRLSLAGAENPEVVVKDGKPWQEKFSDANAWSSRNLEPIQGA